MWEYSLASCSFIIVPKKFKWSNEVGCEENEFNLIDHIKHNDSSWGCSSLPRFFIKYLYERILVELLDKGILWFARTILGCRLISTKWNQDFILISSQIVDIYLFKLFWNVSNPWKNRNQKLLKSPALIHENIDRSSWN